MVQPEIKFDDARPCPFCDLSMIFLTVHDGADEDFKYAAICIECFSTGPSGASADEAIERWNERGHDFSDTIADLEEAIASYKAGAHG